MSKKNLFLYALSLILTCNLILSCSKNDDPVDLEEQEVPEVIIDDLTQFKECLYIPDMDGKPTEQLKIGKATHPDSPKDYYVGVQSFEHAKKLFLSIMALDFDRAEDGNNIILDLKDEKGRGQGFVYFTEASEQQQEKGILAEVTFSPDLHIDGIDRFVFVREIQTFRGDRLLKEYKIRDASHGNPTGLCVIEEWGGGGIIIVPSNSYSKFSASIANTREWNMRQIARSIQLENLREDVNRLLDKMELGLLDDDYWIAEYDNYLIMNVKYTYNFITFQKKAMTSWNSSKRKDYFGKNFLSYWWSNDEQFHQLVFE